MLSQEFQAVYNIFKMNFYSSMCATSKELTMQAIGRKRIFK